MSVSTMTFDQVDTFCAELAIHALNGEFSKVRNAPSLEAVKLRALNLKKYFWNILIALDQLGNTLLFGAPDSTISGRLAREDIVPFLGDLLRKILNGIDKNHTIDADEYDDLGIPDPHHLPGLGVAALEQVMKAGDAYLSLPEALLRIAEQEARLQRLKQYGDTNCWVCGRYL